MQTDDCEESVELIQEHLSTQTEIDEAIKMLPEWKTVVTKADVINDDCKKVRLRFLIAAKTIDDVRAWLEEFQDRTKTTYTIKSTDKCKGKVVNFKQRLHCQHKTACERVYDPSLKNKTKNTNCPSTMTITLRTVKEVHRSKNAPNPELPCEIVLIATHNHDIQSTDALKFRHVSDEVNQKLLDMYKQGHTPGSALEVIKKEIRETYENYEEVLADRKHCPDYRHCHYVYVKDFKNKHEPTEFTNNAEEFLKKRIDEFNKAHDFNAAQITFVDDNYVICICPPLFQRVHQHISSAAEIVLVDSVETFDSEAHQVLTLLTPSACGGLPLGVIITSSKRTDLLKLGFKCLRELVGENIFCGNVDGPQIFLTNDSTAERAALSQVWINSTNLLAIFHVLQSVWKWLLNPENDVPKDKQTLFFAQFKEVLYAKTASECAKKFEEACKAAEPHQHYCQYLEEYWVRRDVWALCYRNNILRSDNEMDTYCEPALKLIKDKIFERTKKYSMVHMIDFICTKFVKYYERRLIDAAHNRLAKNTLGKLIRPPPEGLVEKISQLNNNILSVPSEKTENLYYLVYIDSLMCSCLDGVNDKSCKHVDWACITLSSVTIDDPAVRALFYMVATGKRSEPEVQLPLDVHNYSVTTSVPFQVITSNAISEEVDQEEHVIFEEVSQECAIEDEMVNECGEVDENYNAEQENLDEEMANVFNDMFEHFKVFYADSPREVLQAIKTLNEKMKVQTVSTFVSSCSNFGNEFRRKIRLKQAEKATQGVRRKAVLIEKSDQPRKVVKLIRNDTFFIVPS